MNNFNVIYKILQHLERMLGYETVDATDEQLSRLSDGLRALSHEIPESAAGIETDNILGFTETMANLGVATSMSATEAATSLAKLANITGMSQTDFDRQSPI